VTTRIPFYQVTLEGHDITPWVGSVTVVEDDRQADSVTVTIPDPRLIYADALFEGSLVEVDMGYAERNAHAVLIRAVVTKIDVQYPEGGVPTVTLKGEDKSIEMGLVERKRRWRDLRVTDIVREIARPYGFAKVQAELTPDPLIRAKPIHQDGKTDLAFLQDLAKTYHAKCFVELDERNAEILYFIPERRVVTLRRPDMLVLHFRMGVDSNLISFSPSFDSSYIDRLREASDIDQSGGVVETQERPPAETVVWDLDPVLMAQASPEDNRTIRDLHTKGTQRKGAFQQQLAARKVVLGIVVPDQSELEATNDSLEARRLGMSATGTTFGNIWLRAKSNVQIEIPSQRWRGAWYVSNVTHKIDSSGSFKTDFNAVR
jgi:phage protein D